GDGDFRSLVEAVQRRGVRVTVVSTISTQPTMIADELRREADVFTDLVELKSRIARDPSERVAPREPHTRRNSCSVRQRRRRGVMTTTSTTDRAGLSAVVRRAVHGAKVRHVAISDSTRTWAWVREVPEAAIEPDLRLALAKPHSRWFGYDPRDPAR